MAERTRSFDSLTAASGSPTMVMLGSAARLEQGGGVSTISPLDLAAWTDRLGALTAGLIGYRALRATGDAHRLGLYGFGAAAHIITQVAISEGRRVFAFTRAEDTESQAFARRSDLRRRHPRVGNYHDGSKRGVGDSRTCAASRK